MSKRKKTISTEQGTTSKNKRKVAFVEEEDSLNAAVNATILIQIFRAFSFDTVPSSVMGLIRNLVPSIKRSLQ